MRIFENWYIDKAPMLIMLPENISTSWKGVFNNDHYRYAVENSFNWVNKATFLGETAFILGGEPTPFLVRNGENKSQLLRCYYCDSLNNLVSLADSSAVPIETDTQIIFENPSDRWIIFDASQPIEDAVNKRLLILPLGLLIIFTKWLQTEEDSVVVHDFVRSKV